MRAADAQRYALILMNLKRLKILAAYLLVVCILQITIYVALSISERFDWLFYFDPRMGPFYFESGFRGNEQIAPTLLRWLSAAWILVIALFLAAGRPVLKTYVISELLLSIPNILFVLSIVWANLTPAHGFSVGELIFPVTVMIAFSLIPVSIGIWARCPANETADASRLARA